MKLTKDFTKAWRHWNRLGEISLSRTDLQSDISLPQVIDELDHLTTYTYTLGLEVISGDRTRLGAVPARYLRDLDRLTSQLQESGASDDAKRLVGQYIEETRTLLNEMLKVYEMAAPE